MSAAQNSGSNSSAAQNLADQLARARELILRDRDGQAMELLLGLLRNHPENAANIEAMLALAHLHADRHPQALEHANRAIAVEPDFAWAHLLAGTALAGMGHKLQAVPALEQAIALDPQDSPAYSALGRLLSDLGRVHDAYAAAGRGVELEPHRAASHFAMGYVLHDANPAEARRAYLKTLELEPDHVQAKHNLAGLAAQKGDWHGASEGMANVLADDPSQQTPFVVLDQRLVQTIGRSHWVMIGCWLAYGISSASGIWPAAAMALLATGLLSFMAWRGMRPIRAGLRGSSRHYLRGFPKRESLATAWLVCLSLVPLVMIGGVVMELAGVPDGRFAGASGMLLLILGAILSWVRIPFLNARVKRLTGS